jgi:hypothetical protein
MEKQDSSRWDLTLTLLTTWMLTFILTYEIVFSNYGAGGKSKNDVMANE